MHNTANTQNGAAARATAADSPASYPPNILSARCPSRRVLSLLADKWTLLVMAAISRGITRNNALLRELGDLSQKMLTQTLRNLERNGLVDRRVYPVSPPKVEYTLTGLGQSLIEPIGVLGGWAETHYAQVLTAQTNFDERQDRASDR